MTISNADPVFYEPQDVDDPTVDDAAAYLILQEAARLYGHNGSDEWAEAS